MLSMHVMCFGSRPLPAPLAHALSRVKVRGHGPVFGVLLGELTRCRVGSEGHLRRILQC